MEDKQIIDILTRMPEAERSRDAAFYESLLADKFIFRRGDGSVVDKPAYLGALIDPENTYSSLEQEIVSVQVYEFIAVANVHIRASGRRKGNDFGGTFRNIRVFVRDAAHVEWRLLGWFNEKIADSTAPPSGAEIYEMLFGKPPAKPFVGLKAITIDHLFANLWSRSLGNDRDKIITLRERSLITVAILAAHGRLDELKSHINGALNLGITKDQLIEEMIHVAHYAGWPAGNTGQRLVIEAAEKRMKD